MHTTAFGSLACNQRSAVESRVFVTFLYCIMFLLDWWYSALASLGAYNRVGRKLKAAELAGVSTVVLGCLSLFRTVKALHAMEILSCLDASKTALAIM
jgi:hypothetical protein